jgi:hypothetical protein
MSLMPDPTFYPSPGLAKQAPPERIAQPNKVDATPFGVHGAIFCRSETLGID